MIFLAGLNDILEQFDEIGGRVVFGAEPFCWPDKNLASQYPNQSRGKQYLNSGGERPSFFFFKFSKGRLLNLIT